MNGSSSGPGHSVLAARAARAWTGLGISIATASVAFLLSYHRTLSKIVEQPDIVPRSPWLHRSPSFGNGIETAITYFSLRSLRRSSPHRVLLAFYAGLGFAITILFLKTPLVQELSASSPGSSWHQATLPLLATSFVMICACIVGVRVVFRIPLELRANWIFRITQSRPPSEYFAAVRRAVYIVALAPVWIAAAALVLVLWPWYQALGHLAVLLLLGAILVELWMNDFNIIPFACSYLPGKTNLHITFLLCLMLGLNAIYWSAGFERQALSDPGKFLWMIVLLGIALAFAWRRRARFSAGMELQYHEELPPVITSLGL